MERPKQRWRLELGKFPTACKIFLNDEQWLNVKSLKLTAGYDDANHPIVTELILTLLPDEVSLELDQSLQGDVEHAVFRARRPDGNAHQSF